MELELVSLTGLGFENTNELTEDEFVGVVVEVVGVVWWRMGVVWAVEADPGMEMMEAVRVAEEAKSSPLNAVRWTGVKALPSLFCSCRERG